MNCAPFDLRDYFFGELPGEERQQVEGHLRTCAACREQVESLRLTQTTLHALRDEEIPQRIAFVSDPVFEPSAWRAFWNSTPKLTFAAAAMLSAALVISSFVQRPPAAAPAPAVDIARIEAQVARRVLAVVEEAVAESEARQSRATGHLLAAYEKRREMDQKYSEEAYELLQKRLNVRYLASSNPLGTQ